MGGSFGLCTKTGARHKGGSCMDTFTLWAKAALIRALKTFAQTMVALVGTGMVAFGDVDWVLNLSVSGVAALLSILTSVAGLPEVKEAKALEELPCTPEISE